MTTGIATQGHQLIRDMEDHLVKALASHPRGKSGISVKELQEFSGLTIKGDSGREVWIMGVITLLIEIMKVGRISGEVTSRNTRDWRGNPKVWLPS